MNKIQNCQVGKRVEGSAAIHSQIDLPYLEEGKKEGEDFQSLIYNDIFGRHNAQQGKQHV